MNLSLKYPKCNYEMEQGYIPDHMTQFFAGIKSWHKGKPRRAFLGGGIKSFFGGGVPIGAYRCTDCGYLEFYAWNDFKAE